MRPCPLDVGYVVTCIEVGQIYRSVINGALRDQRQLHNYSSIAVCRKQRSHGHKKVIMYVIQRPHPAYLRVC